LTNLNDQDSLVSTHPDLWTVRRILSWSVDYRSAKSHDLAGSARLDVELLLASVLGLDRMKLYLQLDRPLTKDEREAFKILLRRRAELEPVAYLLGYRDFYRHRFKVDRNVLIPRPDTELLVELAVAALKDKPSAKILDIGTGSGCIAISLAAECPESFVTAWDISDEALAVARTNAESLNVTNVEFVKHDARNVIASTANTYDLIVSNPPYISRADVTQMGPGVQAYEPGLALFTTDLEGLEFYKIFATSYQGLLRPAGKIFLEIGFNQGEKVAHLFEATGWRKIKISKDLSGHDRVVSAEKP
jgi:release factor glutamine methyltransferase